MKQSPRAIAKMRAAKRGANNPMYGRNHTEESKDAIRSKKIGEKNAFYGKHHSEETRKIMSEKKLNNKCSLGFHPTEETRKKLSESRNGRKNHNYGLVGSNNPNFGKHRTEETKKKIGDFNRGKYVSPSTRQKLVEANVGGFCYSHVKYPEPRQYCELWGDVNPRVHAFFNYECCECHKKENGISHVGHHVFYVKKACCWYNDDGLYYTNLNAPKHKANDYFIGENPNYFVILCQSCHGKTNGNYENRKYWADHFRKLIDEQYGGKCYLTKEEFNALPQT
ncbi:MAG: NUMOD3 domain-containing DNA-binding protein [Bacteroidales bacterium]|nr:NUMOD3 domain-containing DNA-binding protein [Bacteroidales bacterium]